MILKKKILVIGDVMLDRYWMGQVNRISPEAPVPILDVDTSVDKPGGAANVAKNLSDFGMDVTLIGLTGEDETSEKLLEILSSTNINYKPIIDKNIRTTMKLRVIDKNQQLMRLDHEDKNLSEVVPKAYEDIEDTLDSYDGIIISDYDKGMVKPIIKKILSKASSLKIKTFIDPKGMNFDFYKNAYLLKPNLKEFEDIAGKCPNKKVFNEEGEKLRRKLKLEYLLITQGKDGMTLFEDGKASSYASNQQDVFDVTGAGDTVVAVFSMALCVEFSYFDAMCLANNAAGVVVGKMGTATLDQTELTLSLDASAPKVSGVVDQAMMKSEVYNMRLSSQRLVVVSGTFAIMCKAHIDFLQQAKRLGDRLLVMAHDDVWSKSIYSLKKPYVGEHERMMLLEHLTEVDYVMSCSEASYLETLSIIKFLTSSQSLANSSFFNCFTSLGVLISSNRSELLSLLFFI